MRLGILSDTHNNLPNLEKALQAFRAAGVEVLIHCGDVTRTETAAHLAGFQVHLTFGNGDVASGELAETLRSMNPASSAGMVFTGKLDNVRLAAAHGHVPGVVDELTRSGLYDFVFVGHSHRRKEERVGATRLINPGALGGLRAGPRSAAILDLALGAVLFLEID
jgi:putative phosphoesterase